MQRIESGIGQMEQVMKEKAWEIVKQFYAELSRLPKSKRILDILSEEELRHLQAHQAQNLQRLASLQPEEYGEHEAIALNVGRIHAIVGLDRDELANGRSILMEVIYQLVKDDVSLEAMAVYSQRLSQDLAYQLKAYQNLADSQQSILLEITKTAWSAQNYTDLIQQAVKILANHYDIGVCAIGRPDEKGVFHFEHVESNLNKVALNVISSFDPPPVVHADDPSGQGPTGRAWRSGKIERVLNFKTQKSPHDIQAMELGLRSCAAIPLRSPDQPMSFAVLLLFSIYPGGFIGKLQETFINLIQSVLGSAIARLKIEDNYTPVVSLLDRQHISALLHSDALQFHYQPILDLRSGSVTKVEALARLMNDDQILTPDIFLAALSPDDFLEMYVRGLNRALLDRQRWLERGIDLDVSLNLPPAAMNDFRYLEATRNALTIHECCPKRLTLEMLENESLALCDNQQTLLSQFKSLGVLLAQDDLGSGHSGLTRLRTLPFDGIKIDRGIVKTPDGAKDIGNARDALRFAYQLTRLGHSLGKWVVVEGIENPEMLEAMMILGVDAVQGYTVAKPMPADQLPAWVNAHSGAPFILALDGVLPRLAKSIIREERLSIVQLYRQNARKAASDRPNLAAPST
ncbi:EAL domain-containing protein [Massilia sp. NEAU-DD11]|uniref:EAL domain-containing protein n=1 Tax=Massilia cellulosiltytica TaxID=2683234 RepID=A0A7X3G0R6_9BURK|nr:EAL domain-containing protein [Telluria cellulosilytica]MVW61539.1 EAL domain-containing protein [Telluria cellulosilytica]